MYSVPVPAVLHNILYLYRQLLCCIVPAHYYVLSNTVDQSQEPVAHPYGEAYNTGGFKCDVHTDAGKSEVKCGKAVQVDSPIRLTLVLKALGFQVFQPS